MLVSQALSIILVLASGSVTFAQNSQEKFEQWAMVTTPTTGEAKVIGGYSTGCIGGASALPVDGDGYVMMKPNRRRNFGHPSLVGYLQALAKTLKAQNVTPLLIEDLSGPRGGPVARGHASHQNGLDVDISLSFPDHELSTGERENLIETSYVTGASAVTEAWTKKQTALVIAAVSRPEVNRIFVAPAIKKYFCDNYSTSPWLYKLRAWWGHDDHIHVRLNCPSGSETCTVQDPLKPTELQCGAQLKASSPYKSYVTSKELSQQTNPKNFPKLPDACESLRTR
jgi:penicillin-insensitive murein endopeptidase